MFCLCGTEETYKMVRMNARLIPTTEKSGLATPLWSDSEFKTLLEKKMDLIVTEKVRQELTQKYEIHPDKTWSVDECKKVLGASIRKNNVKGIICCHREFSVTLATQQSQRNAELEKQNNELRARIYTLTKKLNLKKEAKTDVEVSQPDNIYPDLQAFFETDVALQSVTDVPVNSFNVCGARRRSQGIEETDSVPLNSSVVQIQTVAKALGPKDIERLSQSLPAARTHFSEFRRTLISKMRLYDMSLTEVTQLMSQILTESEFNSFESAVTSELRNASKGDLREGILKILKNILGPKIDWSRITTCVQRKEETVSEYTERFCQWWNPKFRNAATETVKRCVTCQKNNDVPATITPAAHTPAPPGPFRHLQVDYISLPPCKGKTDVLVVIDKFSRWVEAYPTGRATAAHTAKCLVTDFIPRWGLPDCIDSDQGTHFTGQVVKEVSRMLKIKWNLHCPYRPQASGQVERSNRTIKTRLSKMHQEGVPWVEALPAVLCSMRASPNRSVGLSPHEIITGRPMQMPGVIDLRNADVHIASDALIAYCENLTKAVQSAKERVESCWQTPPEGGHTIVPGQWVMIKTFKNKPLEPKWYGPHQVMLITAAAVLCQGRKTWTHVSY